MGAMLIPCLLVALIFGLVPIIEKYVLSFIQVESLLVVSGIVYFVVVALYALLANRNEALATDFRIMADKPLVAALVVLSAFLILIVANYLYLCVLQNNKTHLVTAVIASYPLVTAVVSYMFLNEVITGAHALGILAIVGGVFLVNL